MRELVELMARNLVDFPDEVRVREVEGGRGVVYELSVAPSDMGKIIGKSGRIVRSMRAIVAAAGYDEQRRASIEIV
ncbi:MAG: KH domain-containing protein [Firmicutes bacterium]|nr:KH domain-containing protein [Bacillota bacterium]